MFILFNTKYMNIISLKFTELCGLNSNRSISILVTLKSIDLESLVQIKFMGILHLLWLL